MTDFNKGDFTQQGVDGHVNAKLRLNAKRYVDIDLTSNEETSGCTISGHVYDRLNDITYPIGSAPSGNIEITENTAEGEPLDISQYATATVNVAGGSSDWTTAQITLIPTTYTDQFDIPNNASTDVPVLYNGNYEPLYTPLGNGVIIEIPLYDGEALFILDSFITNVAVPEIEPGVYAPDITGDYTYDNEEGLLTITGNCVIGIGVNK